MLFAKSGALDSLAERRQVVEHYNAIVDFAKSLGDISAQQTDMFSQMSEDGSAKIEFPETQEATLQQKLQWEKETMGLYVSSHPLAGLSKYIGKKAQLIRTFIHKDAGKKVTVAGIVEGIKKITTKKGDTMAIVFLEDPTGKMEITFFPRTYAEVAEYLEKPDIVIVIGGTLDIRGGQLQIRADAVKKASLTRMIESAKQQGYFDEEEAQRGLTVTKTTIEDDSVDAVDDEGNVIAGETLQVEKEEEKVVDEPVGPLGDWIKKGMKTEDATPSISVHTIELPARAPKQLLMDIKKILQTYPGKEKIQLKIGEQHIPLPLTVNMSMVLEKKLEEVKERYAAVNES